MKIAAFMVVKDDEFYVDMAIKSVIDNCFVYVQDQCSTDGTYEKLLELQGRYLGKIAVEQAETNLPKFDLKYNEPFFRSMAVERCERIFNPDWILKLDADEIYTEYFFRRLRENDLLIPEAENERGEVYNGIRVAGDRFISKTRRSVHPSSFEIAPDGTPFVDPHTQLWRSGLGIRYVKNPAFTHFHPVLDPDPRPQYWMPGVCNIHLHRLFGPKAKAFWAEGIDVMDPDKPLHPPTSCPNWYNSDINLGKSEEVDFTWPDYVLEKWASWEGGIF